MTRNLESQPEKQSEDDFKIDIAMCLKTLEKIKSGDRSGLTEIGDIDAYIQNLKDEIKEETENAISH